MNVHKGLWVKSKTNKMCFLRPGLPMQTWKTKSGSFSILDKRTCNLKSWKMCVRKSLKLSYTQAEGIRKTRIAHRGAHSSARDQESRYETKFKSPTSRSKLPTRRYCFHQEPFIILWWISENGHKMCVAHIIKRTRQRNPRSTAKVKLFLFDPCSIFLPSFIEIRSGVSV